MTRVIRVLCNRSKWSTLLFVLPSLHSAGLYVKKLKKIVNRGQDITLSSFCLSQVRLKGKGGDKEDECKGRTNATFKMRGTNSKFYDLFYTGQKQ